MHFWPMGCKGIFAGGKIFWLLNGTHETHRKRKPLSCLSSQLPSWNHVYQSLREVPINRAWWSKGQTAPALERCLIFGFLLRSLLSLLVKPFASEFYVMCSAFLTVEFSTSYRLVIFSLLSEVTHAQEVVHMGCWYCIDLVALALFLGWGRAISLTNPRVMNLLAHKDLMGFSSDPLERNPIPPRPRLQTQKHACTCFFFFYLVSGPEVLA